MCIPSAAAGVGYRGRGWMASWQTVSDLLGADAAYPERNFYQQQHANGRG